MLRQIIVAAAIIVTFSGIARGQILPGDSPNLGIGAAVRSSPGSMGGIMRSHGPEGGSWQDAEGERQYRETLKKIPNRKPSNDPWATIRQTPTASPVDRHRPQ
jgi:hypothetical protein